MRAVEYDRYGPADVLTVREVPRPAPGRGEVLVRVRAAALNPKDVLVRAGKFRLLSGRRFPKRVGFDWSGEVVEVGPGLSGVEPGQRWYGMLDGWDGGACAEYLAVRPAASAPAPVTLAFEAAAAVPLAASTALQALRDEAAVGGGARVLVNGGSGGVGSFAVQIAKLLGAHVTATASGEGVALCRSVGADEVVDHGREDALAAGRRYDVVLDVFGNRTVAEARRALPRGGVHVSTVPTRALFVAALGSRLRGPAVRLVRVRPRASDLALVARWIDEGRLRPVVREVFPLERIREAEQAVSTKHVRGKIVVRVA